ncbi:aminodeoxychorismate synthase component I [Halobacillus litoralis]|uniref:aminodeoxychorismate synthase component I n=1 Tax=Halobacillus litoralis TaxID=45668 RepID=UPI002491FE0B|nr:aminodeoxychorismate synthase component I [Halobacillus litoralis]
MKESPYLIYDFADDSGKPNTKVFKAPVQILSTDKVNEVQGVFEEVEKALDQGYYVAGYVSYEAAPAFDRSLVAHTNSKWPLVWFGVFNGYESAPAVSGNHPFEVSSWKMRGDFNAYKHGMKRIKRGIELGDTYQVNYTTRMEADFAGDDYSFYRKLVRNQQSSYSAYLNMGERRILSASPELFFRINKNKITTKPMKGTAERGRFFQEDVNQKKHLTSSNKEKSENLMIVDLLRNDLGRIAVPGSVRVPCLFEVETYPTVHQMTSTVEAVLPESFVMFELFGALFPCGSITGAPKVRTMKYIKDLEDSSREAYCGAVGYMTPNHEAIFNVPIRTVMIDKTKGKATYGTGGGVTWDSTSEGEFEELKTKTRLLTEDRPRFELLETMKVQNGVIPLLPYHINRLMQSADYFEFPVERDKLLKECEKVVEENPAGLHKVRMLVGESGDCKIETKPIESHSPIVECSLATTPVDERNPFLFHKTTHRQVYNQHKRRGTDATLLWNSKGQLTEFTIANLVVKVNDEYYTPPVECGLLAGTFREKLLEGGVIEEKVIHKEELSQCKEIWMINGVRGWVEVNLTE